MADFNKAPTLTHSGSRRLLRRLELEAYASVVSAFRAQGQLSRDKKTCLELLAKCLGISAERHRAEIRRAVNDEVLGQVANCISGVETEKAWRHEGQKLLSSLPPRLVSHQHPSILPQTLTAITAATHNLTASLGTSFTSNTTAEAVRKVPTPIQNALRVILSHVPLKSDQPPTTSHPGGSGSLPPSKLPSRAPQKSPQKSSVAAKEEVSVVTTQPSASPSKAAAAEQGKVYSQLESLLCEEKLTPVKGGGGGGGGRTDTSQVKGKEGGHGKDESKEEGQENSEDEKDGASVPHHVTPSSASPSTALQERGVGSDSGVGGRGDVGGSGGGMSDGGVSCVEDMVVSAGGASSGGSPLPTLIVREARKRRLSPVPLSDLPPTKKRPPLSSSNSSQVTLSTAATSKLSLYQTKSSTTEVPLSTKLSLTVTTTTSATTKATPIITSKATPITKTAPKATSAIVPIWGESAGKLANSSRPVIIKSESASPTKSVVGRVTPSVQVIPITSSAKPSVSEAIETLNKAISTWSKAYIETLTVGNQSTSATTAVSSTKAPTVSTCPLPKKSTPAHPVSAVSPSRLPLSVYSSMSSISTPSTLPHSSSSTPSKDEKPPRPLISNTPPLSASLPQPQQLSPAVPATFPQPQQVPPTTLVQSQQVPLATPPQPQQVRPTTPPQPQQVPPTTAQLQQVPPTIPAQPQQVPLATLPQIQQVPPTTPAQPQQVPLATLPQPQQVPPTTLPQPQQAPPTTLLQPQQVPLAAPPQPQQVPLATTAQLQQVPPTTLPQPLPQHQQVLPSIPLKLQPVLPATPPQPQQLLPATPPQPLQLLPATPPQPQQLLPATPQHPPSMLLLSSSSSHQQLHPVAAKEEVEIFQADIGVSSTGVNAHPDSLIISDLIQDTSDSAVSSLASQLGLDNAIPLLNLDFMSFFQPSTEGNTSTSSDSMSAFPLTPDMPSLTPDLPSLNVDPVAMPHSSNPLDILSPHLSSPLMPHPLNPSATAIQGHCPSAIGYLLPTQSDYPSACDPSNTEPKPLPTPSAGVTMPTANETTPGTSSQQANLVPPSPVEYLDLTDLGSLMSSADASKLLEGIPEDMAKSIQTIVQLDEQTWK